MNIRTASFLVAMSWPVAPALAQEFAVVDSVVVGDVTAVGMIDKASYSIGDAVHSRLVLTNRGSTPIDFTRQGACPAMNHEFICFAVTEAPLVCEIGRVRVHLPPGPTTIAEYTYSSLGAVCEYEAIGFQDPWNVPPTWSFSIPIARTSTDVRAVHWATVKTFYSSRSEWNNNRH